MKVLTKDSPEVIEFVETCTQAKLRNSSKYSPGETVIDIDPKYSGRKAKPYTFVASIVWWGQYGGYVLQAEDGHLFTTTNIKKPGEERGGGIGGSYNTTYNTGVRFPSNY